MANIPVAAELPSVLSQSPVWLAYFTATFGGLLPFSDPLYKSNGLITLSWSMALQPYRPPLNAPIIDSHGHISWTWLNFMTRLS